MDLDAVTQDKLERFVSNNIGSNISPLVNHFLMNPETLNNSEIDYDNLLELTYKIDYKSAYLDLIKTELDEEELDEIPNPDDIQLVVEDYDHKIDIENYYQEALEFWIINDFLKRKLVELGEPTMDDFFGLTVWGRTTSGQSIALDGVIIQIARDLKIID